MKYDVLFRFREPGQFPEERTLNEPIVLEKGEAALIPDVGDQVTYPYGGHPTDFNVLSRRFAYHEHHCTVNIEVGHPHAHAVLSPTE
jgi:hypothetical protein